MSKPTSTSRSKRYSPSQLRAHREPTGLSRDDVAQHLGKTAGTIRNYEQGRIVPPVHVLAQLADLYGVSVDDLFDPADPDDDVAQYASEIRRVVQAAPPLSPQQNAQLRALLRGVA
jgi:transcriptional regulator with XRE-family HTH domain